MGMSRVSVRVTFTHEDGYGDDDVARVIEMQPIPSPRGIS